MSLDLFDCGQRRLESWVGRESVADGGGESGEVALRERDMGLPFQYGQCLLLRRRADEFTVEARPGYKTQVYEKSVFVLFVNFVLY